MTMGFRFWLLSGLLPLICATATGQRGYPRVDTVFPGAVQRGTTTEVFLTGRFNFREAYRLLFSGEGVSGEVLEWKDLRDPKDKKFPDFPREWRHVKITVADDVPPGVRTFRVLTKGSVSTRGRLLVTDTSTVQESEPNNSIEKAQDINVPTTINGLLDELNDVDIYRFEAKLGDQIVFRAYAATLQHIIPHLERNRADLVLSLRNEEGEELTSADDRQNEDPLLFHRFEKGGVHYLYVREAMMRPGKDRWWYALSIAANPHITSVFPPFVRPGSSVKLQLKGFNLEGIEEYDLAIPRDAHETFSFQAASERGESNVATLALSSLPQTFETDPSKPVKIQIPTGINGRISKDGQVDRYRFEARRGQGFEFKTEVSRCFGSLLDPILELRDLKGKLLAAHDDRFIAVGQTPDTLSYPLYKDARIEWTAPADGIYEIAVRDANFFGSPDHVYHLVALHQEGDFAMVLDEDRFPLGPGESVTSVVTVERLNGFAGSIRLGARGLPKGVTLLPSTIPANLNQGNLVLTASPHANPDAATKVEFYGTATVRTSDGHSKEIERIVQAHSVLGENSNRLYYPVRWTTVAVTEGSDLILKASPNKVTLRPGDSVTININVKRDNFDGPFEVNVIHWNLLQRFNKLPPGVIFDESRSKTSIGPNESEAIVTFRVEEEAPPLDDYLMTILGQISYTRVFMTKTAAPFRLTIRPRGHAFDEQ